MRKADVCHIIMLYCFYLHSLSDFQLGNNIHLHKNNQHLVPVFNIAYL